MKKLTALILAILTALLFTGCALTGRSAGREPDGTCSLPTERPSETPTETPTAAVVITEAPEVTPEPGREIVLTKYNFDEEIAGDTPILVDFWASWCGPCMMLAPTVEELARESDGSYRVGKVNIDEQLELMERFEISAIPLLIVFKNGEEVARNVGYMEKDQLIELIGSAKAE